MLIVDMNSNFVLLIFNFFNPDIMAKKLVFAAICVMITSGSLSAQSKFQKMFWSKRYKTCLAERDSLCAENKVLRKDTANLGADNRKKDSLYAELTASYNQLKSLAGESDRKLIELTDNLQNKSKELSLKEKNLQDKDRALMEKDQKLKELHYLLNRQDSILNALNSTVKKALLGLKSDEFAIEMKNGKVYVSLSDKLLFKSGNANVEEKGKDAIKKLSEVLSKNTDIDIAIEGHTDSIPIKTGLYKDNWDLSVARSTNIVRMLTADFNIEPKRVTASGKGEFLPVASNETSEGRAKNRRTEIVLSPKLEELFKLLNPEKNEAQR